MARLAAGRPACLCIAAFWVNVRFRRGPDCVGGARVREAPTHAAAGRTGLSGALRFGLVNPHPVLADTSACGHREPRDRAPGAETRVVIAHVRQYRQAASAGASTTRSAETTILAMQLVHHSRLTQSHAGDSTSAMYLPGSGNPSGITGLARCI